MTNQIQPEREKPWKHRADNRQRLITAGYSVLAEKGYEATTVKEVAHCAGVSPGLFHYYFASKDELLLAVLNEAGQRYGQRMRDLRTEVPAAHFLEAVVAAAQERTRQEPEWYRLRYELFALGLRNAAFLPGLGERLAYIRQIFTRALQDLTGREEAQAQAVAAVLLACFDGLALQQLAEPEVDLTGAYDLLLTMMRSADPPAP